MSDDVAKIAAARNDFTKIGMAPAYWMHKHGQAILTIAERLTAKPAESQPAHATDELAELESEARRFAGFYNEGSDGRNTFLIFADKIAAIRQIPPSPSGDAGNVQKTQIAPAPDRPSEGDTK